MRIRGLLQAFIVAALTTASTFVTAQARTTTVVNFTSYAGWQVGPPCSCSGPYVITAGPDGNLWYTDTNGNAVVRVTPGGAVTAFPLPTGNPCCAPFGITSGPDGKVWFTEWNGNSVDSITTDGTLHKYGITQGECASATGGTNKPQMITVGPDGNLWFTVACTAQIGRLTPQGRMTLFNVPVPTTGPFANDPGSLDLFAIAPGPDGNIWFTEAQDGNAIGRITMQGVVTIFPLPLGPYSTSGNAITAIPGSITTGPDGNLWFTENQGQAIGQMRPDGTLLHVYPLDQHYGFPGSIVSGPDGDLWFDQVSGSGDWLVQMTTRGRVTYFPFPTASDCGSTLTVAPASQTKTLWFARPCLDFVGYAAITG